MHCLSLTPLAREHAERLAREDAAKAAAAQATRLANIRRWESCGARVTGLRPFTPRSSRTSPRATPQIAPPRVDANGVYRNREEKIKVLLAELQNHPDGLTPTQLGNLLGYQQGTTRHVLMSLLKDGRVASRLIPNPCERGPSEVPAFFLPPAAGS